jgi:hypothetical protein
MTDSQNELVDETAELRVPDLSELLAIDDKQEAWVDLPKWGYKVKVRSLSKAEQMKLRKQATVSGKVDQNRLEGLLLVNGMVEPKMTIDHINTVFQKQGGLVDKILVSILDLSGMTDEPQTQVEAEFPGEW